MPIRSENVDRYPDNWDEVVEKIRQRSGNVCEGSPDYPLCRAVNKQPHPVTGSKVVLTVAHLDHMPENCAPGNLRHWCQRCHLNYDKDHHKENSAKTRRERHPVKDMFDD